MPGADHPKSAPGVPYIFPDWLDRIQMAIQSPLIKRFRRVPCFAIISHRGRKSGHAYETVVRGYTKGSLFSVMLGHGMADWVKNVLAAGEADVQTFRGPAHITDPRVIPIGGDVDYLPLPVRLAARRVGIFVADITSI